MRKKNRQKKKAFDEEFDAGKRAVDFSKGVLTSGLSKVVKFPPMNVPAWLALEIGKMAKRQANSKSAVVRQLLVEAIEARKKAS